ncbi:MAG: 3-deoxy-7-phosphoheptulonate synthase [Myxococcales bacterium]|nr:3-deoxy-7-phosphoheptulonate synthase [Myxococcales bacterium]
MTTVLTLHPGADQVLLRSELQRLGVWAQPLTAPGGQPAGFALAAHSNPVPGATLAALPGVASVLASQSGHPLLDARKGEAVHIAPGIVVGAGHAPVLVAGPCSAESARQVRQAAEAVKAAGGAMLRGGAFKPRTSPYAFTGAGVEGLRWLRDAADEFGLGLVTECLSERDAAQVSEAADLVQVGSRNMQNFALLKAIGAGQKPVLLKRGASATLHEWRLAAEHLLAAGADGVIFCERGVRGVGDETRNVLDLGAVAVLAAIDRLPVWVDPSHAAGRRDLIAPLAKAGLAVGAHGLLVEAHPDAATALSDGAQALPLDALAALMPHPTELS